MPYADPVKNQDRIRQLWRERGHIYRANRPAAQPPVSRQQVLDEDVAQAVELAKLEAKRIGRRRARQRFEAFLAGERRWLRVTSSRFRLEDPDGGR